MKNKTFHFITGMGVLLASFISSGVAYAYVPGVWEKENYRVYVDTPYMEIDSPSVNTSTSSQGTQTQSQPAKTQTQSTSFQPQSVAKKTTATTSKKVATASKVTKKAVTPEKVEMNSLSASAGNTSGSFMPDTILEWILVIFLIAIIVILSRKFTKKTVKAPAH